MKTNNYPAIIEKIHTEYYQASDKLVQEALSIINNIKINEDKHAKLKSLGLVNTPEFKALEAESIVLRKQRGLTDLVESYRVKYPNYKFISTEDVIIINKKYGLLLGGLNDFKGFVPQSNLDDIVKFKTKYLDYKKITYQVEISKCQYTSDRRKSEENKRILQLFGPNKTLNVYVPSYNDPDTLPSSFKRDVLIALSDKHSVFDDMRKGYEGYTLNYTVKHPSLCICATGKEMGLTEAETKKFSGGLFDLLKSKQKEHKFEVNADPIVLHPVPYGYIIVTAWGDEAEDPLVVNQNNN